jgi:hypothetical protein
VDEPAEPARARTDAEHQLRQVELCQ